MVPIGFFSQGLLALIMSQSPQLPVDAPDQKLQDAVLVAGNQIPSGAEKLLSGNLTKKQDYFEQLAKANYLVQIENGIAYVYHKPSLGLNSLDIRRKAAKDLGEKGVRAFAPLEQYGVSEDVYLSLLGSEINIPRVRSLFDSKSLVTYMSPGYSMTLTFEGQSQDLHWRADPDRSQKDKLVSRLDETVSTTGDGKPVDGSKAYFDISQVSNMVVLYRNKRLSIQDKARLSSNAFRILDAYIEKQSTEIRAMKNALFNQLFAGVGLSDVNCKIENIGDVKSVRDLPSGLKQQLEQQFVDSAEYYGFSSSEEARVIFNRSLVTNLSRNMTLSYIVDTPPAGLVTTNIVLNMNTKL